MRTAWPTGQALFCSFFISKAGQAGKFSNCLYTFAAMMRTGFSRWRPGRRRISAAGLQAEMAK